jgi:hybrid cluster-associated redox disulfide protein
MPALTCDMTVAELLSGWPAAGPALARRGMACVGCAMATFETVGEAARAYGVDPEELLRAVASAARSRRRGAGGARSRR